MLEKQYHPTPEQLKVRKARHRRSGSQGSGNTIQMQGSSPRISPLRERRGSCQAPQRQSRIFEENVHSHSDMLGMPVADEVDAGDISEKESRSLNEFKPAQQECFQPHAFSTGATPRPKRGSKSSQRSSIASISLGHDLPTMVNNYIPSDDCNNGNGEDPINMVNPYSISTRQYYSSSEDSSDNECRIIPVEKDDYLETLDRKVTEVINQSRISNVGIVGSTTSEQMNRKSSMERRRHLQRTKPSPGSNKRIFMKTPSSSDNHEGHGISSSNNIHDDNISNGNVLADTNNSARISSYLPSIVRFDESNENNNRDASSDTQESSQERWSDGADAESEEGGHLDDRNIIKRRR